MEFTISKEQTTFIKGISILLIVCHNFFNVLFSACDINEFSFVYQNFLDFAGNINSYNWVRLVLHYFGHYGVQLFVFLSGYGLAVSYQQRKNAYWGFVKKRLRRLYPAFVFAVVAILLTDYSLENVKDAFLRLTLISNWIPGKIFVLIGPHWFYAMIIQLYLLFPVFIWMQKRYTYGIGVLMILTITITYLTNPFFIAQGINLHYNFFGNMPVFLLGILLTDQKQIQITKPLWLLALVVFIIGQFMEIFWYVTQLSFVVITIPVMLMMFKKLKNNWMKKSFLILGGLSMYIFAIHEVVRYPWVWMAYNPKNEILYFIFLGAYLAVIYFVSDLMRIVLKKREGNIRIMIARFLFPSSTATCSKSNGK